MRRYPALLWIVVFVGSLFVLNGGQSSENAGLDVAELVLGIGLIAVALVGGTWLAFRPEDDRPVPDEIAWIYAATAGFYVTCAAGALIVSDTTIAAAALLAGLIPLTAVSLWIAQVRRRTPDPVSPETHDEITPHDLRKDHPGRRAAELQAARRGELVDDPERREGANLQR
jgi:hypothetical protein